MKGEIKKKIAIIVTVIALMTAVCGCENKKASGDSQSTESISTVNAGSVSIKLKGTSAEISGEGATEKNGVVTINSAGTYVLSGEMTKGRVIVDADKESEVTLVLYNASIKCDDNAPIFVEKAKNVFLTLADGSENSVTDGESYSLGDNDSNVDGAIFSRCDLTINGGGKLSVSANYKHAIVGKDAVLITGGEYLINAVSGGIYGKDSVVITDGSFDITSGSNAVKSSNSEQSDMGNVKISGGVFNITAGNDAIESANMLEIDGGEFNITTGGGSENASMRSDGMPNENWGKWDKGMNMHKPQGDMAEHPENPDGEMGEPPQMPNDVISQTANATVEDTTGSAKGLKAEKSVTINGGKISIDSSDDSIHSNGTVTINGGELTLSSGDDGVHADAELLLNGGNINVQKSYEGLEGVTVTIQDGDINVTATDDGINAAGGSDTGSADRIGRDNFADASKYLLKITGGKTVVNASGDGVDSNGDIVVEGGELYVNGPLNDGNGALDYGEGASAYITGGTVVACGSSGMAVGFGEENSTQYSVLHNFDSKISAGTELSVTDSKGNVVLKFIPEKDYQSVVFSCKDLDKGKYTITAGSVSDEITIESIVTSNGGGMGFGRPFGHGIM